MSAIEKAKYEDLAWFDIKNYDFINELSIGDYLREIEWRNQLLLMINHYPDIPACFKIDEAQKLYYEWITGIEYSPYDKVNHAPKPYIGEQRRQAQGDYLNKARIQISKEMKDISEDKYNECVVNRSLSIMPHFLWPENERGGELVRLLTVRELERLSSEFITHKDDVRNNSSVGGSGDRVIYDPSGLSGGLYISIFLDEKVRDEDILYSLKGKLKEWREELRIKSPVLNEKKKGIREGRLSSIVEKRILPLIDIFIWETVEKKKASKPDKYRKLYGYNKNAKIFIKSKEYDVKYEIPMKWLLGENINNKAGFSDLISDWLKETPWEWKKKIKDFVS